MAESLGSGHKASSPSKVTSPWMLEYVLRSCLKHGIFETISSLSVQVYHRQGPPDRAQHELSTRHDHTIISSILVPGGSTYPAWNPLFLGSIIYPFTSIRFHIHLITVAGIHRSTRNCTFQYRHPTYRWRPLRWGRRQSRRSDGWSSHIPIIRSRCHG